ncbi:MAG: oligosaccharide flippase family protein, partial [Thermoplasmata archaeon]|nr:oligosaccharide flippase family protein [Thermoplasmata archaeon]
MTTPSPAAPTEEDLRAFTSVGRGTVILILGTLVLFAASFASRVLIAQSFPLADWGMFNIALALTGLLSLLALIGLDQAAARSLSFERDPALRRSIARWAVSTAVVAAIVSSTLLFLLAAPLAALFRAGQLTGIFQLFSVTVGFGLLGLMIAALFQGCEDAAPNAVFNQILNPVLFVAAVVAALVFHLGFEGVLVGYVVTDGVALAALVVYALLRLPGRLPSAPGPTPPTPRLWSLAQSFWGVGSLAFVTAFVDTLILGVFRPATDVGLYSAAMTISRVLLVGNGALTYIYLPVAARLARDHNLAAVRSNYLAGTRWSLLVVTPLFLLFAFLPVLSLSAV